MKKAFLIIPMTVVALITGSCDSKEKQLINQIRQMPDLDLIDQYLKEYPNGEFKDSLKAKYAPIAGRIWSANRSKDFSRMLAVADETDIDSVKRWANEKAEEWLADSIQKNGTEALCDIFLTRFPNSKLKSYIDSKKQLLAKEEEKAEAEASQANSQAVAMINKINSLHADVKQIYRDFSDLETFGRMQGEPAANALYEANELIQKIKKINNLTPELQAKISSLSSTQKNLKATLTRKGW